MPQIPTEYSQVAHEFTALVNVITIRQKATEIALKKSGISDEVWKAALNEATSSIGWVVDPESSTKTLEDFLEGMRRKLLGP
jgi:hypothetical protein